jgi:hypothetical protein
MDIYVANHAFAREFLPGGDAAAIRIFGSARMIPAELKGKYRSVHEYLFDETKLMERGLGGIRFNGEIAARILSDFAGSRNGCEQLLVHCFSGEARSPAVARALYERFGLDGKVYVCRRGKSRGGNFACFSPVEMDEGVPDWDWRFGKLDREVYNLLMSA